MAIELNSYQLDAIWKLKNGSVLCGGVGSGKSRTALGYFMFRECEGLVKVITDDQTFKNSCYKEMKKPKNLFIITTAKKRDSLEWVKECGQYRLFTDQNNSHSGVKVTIDSWNNIQKYKSVHSSFFIFDEQRVVGSGAWVKAFLNITRKNHWILLSATPGDQWKDYIPVFVANGFYKNKTDFQNQHCVFSRYSKYPKIERYVGERMLQKHRDDILVPMKDLRETVRNNIYLTANYDREKYRTISRNYWNPYENCPIEESGMMVYLLRRVVNEDPSRIDAVGRVLNEKYKVIIFYNFHYELVMLKEYLDSTSYPYTEWNGKRHEDILSGERWVYLVQYTAGCEGWNCITTDTIIFFSQNYSYRILEQSSGRIDRINTPYKDLYYYHIISQAPIDRAIKRKLSVKENFNEQSYIARRNQK